MKQRITPKQLNELNKKGKKRLALHANKKNMEGDDNGIYWYTQYLPLLSIGQMIEFLDEKEGWVSFDRSRKEGWRVFIDQPYKDYEKTKNKELCDALWQVVKEELKK